MMTHLNIVSAATSITTYLENTADDVIFNVLPFSFDYGLYPGPDGFQGRRHPLLERSFAYPYVVVLEALARERVTGLPIVPTIASMLLQMDLGREVTYRSPLHHEYRRRPRLPIMFAGYARGFRPSGALSMYGLTECKRVSYLPPEQLDMRPTSVGRGMPNEQVYIVDEGGGGWAPASSGS